MPRGISSSSLLSSSSCLPVLNRQGYIRLGDGLKNPDSSKHFLRPSTSGLLATSYLGSGRARNPWSRNRHDRSAPPVRFVSFLSTSSSTLRFNNFMTSDGELFSSFCASSTIRRTSLIFLAGCLSSGPAWLSDARLLVFSRSTPTRRHVLCRRNATCARPTTA